MLLCGSVKNFKTIEIKIPLKRDASGPEGCSDTIGMDWEFCIRQGSDYNQGQGLPLG